MLRKIIWLFITMLALPACLYGQRYPENWPQPLSTDAGCPSVAGIYNNIGESANGNKARLSVVLYPTGQMVYNSSITHVEIKQDGNDLIKVIIWSEDKVFSEKSYLRAKNEFSCESGWIVINQAIHPDLSGFILGVNLGQDQLSKSSNGDLIVQGKGSVVGLFIILPVIEVDWLWFRFKPKDEISAQTSSEVK